MLLTSAIASGTAMAATWSKVTAPAGHNPFSMFTQTDGSILVGSEYNGSKSWYKLTPNSAGSYTAGTWTKMADAPIARLYFGCGVMPDGKIPMIGGEYVNGSSSATWSNLCHVYNPATNSWSTVVPPASGWAQIGDATSAVLADGRFMFGNAFNSNTAFYDTTTNAITPGPLALNRTNEEGWTLMFNNALISPDAVSTASPFRSERYNPETNSWSFDSNVPVNLFTSGKEPGAGITVPTGQVFHTGGLGFNARYTPNALPSVNGTWTTAANFPAVGVVQGAVDAMVSLLPSGNVMCVSNQASSFSGPSNLWLYDYRTNTMTDIVEPEPLTLVPCYTVHFTLLPSGQMAMSYGANYLWIYTPDTVGINNAWRPYSIYPPAIAKAGDDIIFNGEQLNGLSVGSNYGDEGVYNTNFPIVRFRNVSTGVVTYGRTHDHSTMAIGPNHQRQSSRCAIPATLAPGTYEFLVSANGLSAASPETITISTTVNRVSGTIGLANWTYPWEEDGIWTTFDLIDTTTNAVVETRSIHITKSGAYQFYTEKTGTFRLRAKTFHWLSNQTTTFTFLGGTQVTKNATLINGDADQDNEVSILDYLVLSEHYGTTAAMGNWYSTGPSGWRPVDADFDGDEEVSILDYIILSNSYGLQGI